MANKSNGKSNKNYNKKPSKPKETYYQPQKQTIEHVKVPGFVSALTYLGKMSLILLAFISIIITSLFIYVKYTDTSETIGVNNISDQVAVDILEVIDKEELSESDLQKYEDRWLFNLNIYDNSNNNGQILQEMRLDYFTDYTLSESAYRSTGMQFLGDIREYNSMVRVEDGVDPDTIVVDGYYYYDTTNGISWNGGKLATQLNRDKNLIIKIDNEPYLLTLDKTKQWYTYGKLDILKWFPQTNIYYYTYSDVFKDCVRAVMSNSQGYGDYYITVNLSEYFSVKKYNPENGKFDIESADIIENYAVLKFHYDKNGVLNSSQSLFNKIALNSAYDVTGYDDEMWNVDLNYNFTEEHLEYRYSESRQGHYCYLNSEIKNLLNNTQHKVVNITIDFDSDFLKDYTLLGFDYNAFEGLPINTITLKSDNAKEVDFLSASLKNTGIKTIQRSNCITLNFEDGATNSTFKEVILWYQCFLITFKIQS